MPDYIVTNDRLIAKTWCPIDKIDDNALEQIKSLGNHPFLYKWAAIMPDCHYGKGATIGSVIPMEEVIIPSCVGVDLGCGVCTTKTNLKVDDIKPHLEKIDHQIRRSVPMGFNHRKDLSYMDKYPLSILYQSDFEKRVKIVCDTHMMGEYDKVFKQLGTLGGGNHFIELQYDSEGYIYIMIHSGSRNFGLQIANKFIKNAKAETNKYRYRVPKDLDFLHYDSDLGKAYVYQMRVAVEFAYVNRYIMMMCIQDDLQRVFPGVKFEEYINIPHNYASLENHFGKNVWVHRKGATHVTEKITGIIPGSMGTKSYIVKGTGDKDSYLSCSHGAGRVLGRNKAKELLDLEGFQKSMEGVFSKDINEKHLDESPAAYKNIDEIMEHQKDLVVKEVELTPVLNLKG